MPGNSYQTTKTGAKSDRRFLKYYVGTAPITTFNAMASIQIHDLHFVPLIPEDVVQARVTALGKVLHEKYAGQKPLFISVLNGAFMFAADLVRAFDGACEVSFVKIASYVGTRSSGDVQTHMGLNIDIAGRHLIVVEDIVDTGRTLHFFMEQLKAQNPASIAIAACLRKPDAMEYPLQVDYVGFDIENKFVVGYGLDYDGVGRNLRGIWVLEE